MASASGAKTEYKWVGGYAHTLNSGRPVEPGETVKLTKEDVDDNKDLIDNGTLVETEGGKN